MDDSRISCHDGDAERTQILRWRQTASTRSTAERSTDGPRAKDGSSADGDASAADLFALLWIGLADILGTAAAATLLRRAAQCALPRAPELVALRITREGLEYRYTVPSSWSTSPASDASGALAALARELWPLLVELTGSVVIRRLAQLPELRALAVASREGPEA